jgi:hypothetical protein
MLLIVAEHRLLHRHGAGEGIQGAREDDHESIAQVLHLLPASGRYGIAEEAEVSAPQHPRLVVTEHLEQLGRALKIGKQKGGGSDARLRTLHLLAARGRGRLPWRRLRGRCGWLGGV